MELAGRDHTQSYQGSGESENHMGQIASSGICSYRQKHLNLMVTLPYLSVRVIGDADREAQV